MLFCLCAALFGELVCAVHEIRFFFSLVRHFFLLMSCILGYISLEHFQHATCVMCVVHVCFRMCSYVKIFLLSLYSRSLYALRLVHSPRIFTPRESTGSQSLFLPSFPFCFIMCLKLFFLISHCYTFCILLCSAFTFLPRIYETTLRNRIVCNLPMELSNKE